MNSEACLPAQVDVALHVDLTHAVEPLERSADLHDAEAPGTCPAGI